MKLKPFITGSSAYGPFTEESDIDIVMYYHDADRLKIKLEKAGFEIREPGRVVNQSYTGFEFDIAGRVFNIICVATPDEYEQWMYMTDKMRFEDEMYRKERIAKANELRERKAADQEVPF